MSNRPRRMKPTIIQWLPIVADMRKRTPHLSPWGYKNRYAVMIGAKP